MAGLAAIEKVIRTRRNTASAATIETAYCLLSAVLSPERPDQVARSHWGVENRLHWVLNAVRHQDKTGNRNDNGAHNLAILRHIAFNPMQRIDLGCRCAANSTWPLGREGSWPSCFHQFENLKRPHKCKMQINFDTFRYQTATRGLTRPRVPPHVKAAVAKYDRGRVSDRVVGSAAAMPRSEGFDCLHTDPDLFGLSRPVDRT